MPPSPPSFPRRAYFLFFLSGASGLGYQWLWTRRFTTVLGHEIPALVGVLSAFFGGMAVGGWLWNRCLQRRAPSVRWFAWLELILGGWAIASVPVISWADQVASALLGAAPSLLWHWIVAVAVPLFVLLPATAAMGATLPAMERWLAEDRTRARSGVGAAFAANTLGAVVGVLSAAFWFASALGFQRATLVYASANLVAGLGALVLMRTSSTSPPGKPPAHRVPSGPEGLLPRRRILASVFFTGLLGIGYEIAGIRGLSQVLPNSVFTFALTLAIYLVGIALGAAAFQFWPEGREPTNVLEKLLLATTIALLLGVLAGAHAETIYGRAKIFFGNSAAGSALAQVWIAAAVFLLPTFVMGALFSHLAQQAAAREALGAATAYNLLGGGLAGVVFGLGVLPLLGAKGTFLLLAAGYLALLPRWPRGSFAVAGVVPVALIFLLPANLRIVDLAPGASIAEFHEGVLATVAVVRNADGNRLLRVDNRLQMGSTTAANAQRRQAALPLMLHPAPQRALFLGIGTGMTLGAALEFPDLRVDAVELIPEIIRVLPEFSPENRSPENNSRCRILCADARRFVRSTRENYDVIVADVFHPARDGAALLYTREHFQAIYDRLSPDGQFCQWLPAHQLDPEALRLIVRTFLEVFPEARAIWLHFNVDVPVVGLIGSRRPILYRPNWVETRFAGSEQTARLKELGLKDSLNLFGMEAASASSLRAFAAGAALNTDDRPRLLFSGGRLATLASNQTFLTVRTLLREWQVNTAKLFEPRGTNASTAWLEHFQEFVGARNQYFEGLMAEAEGNFSSAVDTYLQSTKTSLYFTPAYARLVTIISVMAKTSRPEALQLYHRLLEAQPRQPLGRQMLGPLLESDTAN